MTSKARPLAQMLHQNIDGLIAENKQLKAEIERLRIEVANLLDALSLPCPTCGDTRDASDHPGLSALEPTV